MYKRLIYIGSPSKLSTRNNQLIIKNTETEEINSIPISDIAFLELDNAQITISNYTLFSLLKNSVSVLVCDETHNPKGLLVSLEDNVLQTQRIRFQVNAKKTLLKNLWRQIVFFKILNQKRLLDKMNIETEFIKKRLQKLKTGDKTNIEGLVSAYYWKRIFNDKTFVRDRYGSYPNNLLNYGYAVLRAIISRSLVANGLCLSIGIHHKNQYNPFCLADDIMEPYRPFVDKKVQEIYEKFKNDEMLSKDAKKELLSVPLQEIEINKESKTLTNAIYDTCTSLVKCYIGENKSLLYPLLK